MSAVLRHAFARLRRDRTRALLAAGGIAAAGAMVGAAVTLAYGLSTGFDRTANAADLPDAVARFDPVSLTAVDARARALPNVESLAYRLEATHVRVTAGGRSTGSGILVGVRGGRRGYALVEGRDVRARGEAVVERGLARSWRLQPGEPLEASGAAGLAQLRIVGVAVAPDSVAYPLVRTPRVWTRYEDTREVDGAAPGTVDEALVWVHDPARLDVTLAQARAASFGLESVRFVTRSGFRALIGRAAGIVIALLVAFSLIALGAAGTMLAASAAAEVQRRLQAIGTLRALGAAPGEVARGYALEAAAVAAPAAALGVTIGWATVGGPTERLLGVLDELPPGRGLVVLLAACVAAIVAVVAAATAWPAWRAARRPPVANLRGADVVATPRRTLLPGLGGLGMRLALARPLRTAALAAVLAASAAVVLLILTIASLLRGLEQNAQTLGTRYQLSLLASPADAARIRAVPGVAAVAPRYDTDAADSFSLGESFELIAFPGDHTSWEAPPLAEGRRLAGDAETEVGRGLAQALNLHLGSTLAAAVGGGGEVRFRVVGIVDALRHDGLIAYVRPRRLVAPAGLVPTLAVRLRPGASSDAVRAALQERGFLASRVGGIATETAGGGELGRTAFLPVLAAVLRSVAILDGLVCLYALAQMLALIAHERRRGLAVLRALGGGRREVLSVLAGSGVLVAALAAPVGILAERLVLGPEVARLAASYVTLGLGAGAVTILVVLAGLAVAVAAAALLATRSALAQPVVAALREE